VSYFATEVVLAEGVEVEEDPVGEVEVGDAGLDDEVVEFLIGQVLLNHHVGDDLRDEVLEVVALPSPLDHRIDPFGRQQAVDPRRTVVVLVEVVQDLVYRLLIAVLDVPEFLSRPPRTMLDDCSRLSIGIFSEKCYFFSESSS
jgi:hypothetical protein